MCLLLPGFLQLVSSLSFLTFSAAVKPASILALVVHLLGRAAGVSDNGFFECLAGDHPGQANQHPEGKYWR